MNRKTVNQPFSSAAGRVRSQDRCCHSWEHLDARVASYSLGWAQWCVPSFFRCFAACTQSGKTVKISRVLQRCENARIFFKGILAVPGSLQLQKTRSSVNCSRSSIKRLKLSNKKIWFLFKWNHSSMRYCSQQRCHDTETLRRNTTRTKRPSLLLMPLFTDRIPSTQNFLRRGSAENQTGTWPGFSNASLWAKNNVVVQMESFRLEILPEATLLWRRGFTTQYNTRTSCLSEARFWKKIRQACSQVLRFGREIYFYGGKIFVKQIFLGTSHFGGHKIYIGGHCPRMRHPPRLRARESDVLTCILCRCLAFFTSLRRTCSLSSSTVLLTVTESSLSKSTRRPNWMQHNEKNLTPLFRQNHTLHFVPSERRTWNHKHQKRQKPHCVFHWLWEQGSHQCCPPNFRDRPAESFPQKAL